MKRKLYTKSHNIDLLKEIDNNGKQFTADEHAYVIEREFGDAIFETKETLFRHYLPKTLDKLASLRFLLELIDKKRYTTILSLGAGPCVLEYLLKASLPEDSRIIACDFDAYLVEKAKLFFPEITTVRFDFFKDDIESLLEQLKARIDLAVFFGSAYVMDDEQFIKLFEDLRKAGTKTIIDFHAGYMDSKEVFKTLLRPIARNSTIRKIIGKRPMDAYPGKFHGYSRNRSELRKLYGKANLVIREEMTVGEYKYVAVLEPS